MMKNIDLFDIKSIEELDFKDVYDITMENRKDYFQDEHNYIANNILVHNSHPAGIVVSDVPLEQIAPLRRAKKGTLATQYDKDDLELLGLIKFDILAISTLTVIKKTLKMIKENYDLDIDIKNLPLKDKSTFDLYKTGNLAGVFQCESWPMQNTMKEMEVDCFDDIMAAISLFRPGPMDNIPEYCSRKKGISDIDYFHPTIKPFVEKHLKRTYGILVYQESIMQICNSLAGFDIAEGYVVIKAIGKKKKDLMGIYENKFVEGCVKNKVPENVAQQYWNKFIVPFASYGFNLCLDGSMCVKDENSNKIYTIKELETIFKEKNKNKICLNGYVDGKIIKDELIDVFETGEKDVYEVELNNGIVLRCTLDHKFLCSDEKMHTIKDIIENELDVLYF